MTPALWILPFAMLLLAIAVFPLLLPERWAHLKFQALVAGVVSLPVLLRFALHGPGGLAQIAHEYISFVVLLGSLYVVASGIVVDGDVPATPRTNTLLLLMGGVLASLIGTTGASMLLIRLVLDVNVERKQVSHTVLFFILIVSNIGGSLTPIGDPPLFLGYLAGVPFFWTLVLLKQWAVALGVLLAAYYLIDRRFHARETRAALLDDALTIRPIRISGKWNFVLLLGVVLATVFLPSPWRETASVACAAASFPLTTKGLRAGTGFTWHPILEVAVLFAGIFVTMEPALVILRERAPTLGLTEPWQFFWATGALSSWLDNAPTYAAFFALARGLGRPEVAGVPANVLEAVSAGAVFFGAMTYIGNGPNFMVKAIAEAAGVRMPGFFGYLGWALVILLPILVVHAVAFIR